MSVRAFNNFGESEPVIAVATAGNEHCKSTLIRGLLISRKKENARAELTLALLSMKYMGKIMQGKKPKTVNKGIILRFINS